MAKAEGGGNLLRSSRAAAVTAQSHAESARGVTVLVKPQIINQFPQVIVPGAGIPLVLPGQALQ